MASLTFMRRFFERWPKRPGGSMSLMLMSISSTPWEETISKAGKLRSRTSTSTVRSLSFPSRICARSFSRVRCKASVEAGESSLAPRAGVGWGGRSKSSSRSSAFCSAFSETSSSFSSRTMSIEISTRSLTMDSTSRPT